jgi:VanZ family protein
MKMLDASGLRTRRIAFALCAALVLVVSLMPAPEALPLQTGWDKSDHALAFLVLGLLGLAGWPAAPGRLLSALVGYGVLIELLQGTTSYRSAQWSDLIADVVGLVAAACLWRVLQAARERRRNGIS